MRQRILVGRLTWAAVALCAAGLLGLGAGSASAAVHKSWKTKSSYGSTTSHMSGPVSDANIAAIVTTANKVDIQNAREAERISKNPKVLEFARRMTTDHTAANRQAMDLAKRLNLTPKPDALSRSLETSGTQTRSRMMSMTGASFDRAYIDNEVKLHESVLNVIDNTLLPNVQNADLKKLIQDTRPVIEEHLRMAKDVQSQLSTGSNSYQR
ncbi:MAG TPA: DUF4142 domain-containing protein [Terriglobales bacterium]|nr:DUF4142 domain-containing protein [Terriglobales bacterium]